MPPRRRPRLDAEGGPGEDILQTYYEKILKDFLFFPFTRVVYGRSNLVSRSQTTIFIVGQTGCLFGHICYWSEFSLRDGASADYLARIASGITLLALALVLTLSTMHIADREAGVT
jgi:hypothetical protein